MKNILFIVQYPKSISPGQRFRIELYEDSLTRHGFSFDTSWFLDAKARSIIYKEGHIVQKVLGVLRGFMVRVTQLFSMHKYDFVFIYREAAPLGPPIFEWIYTRILRKKVIYDFDDSIWIPGISAGNELVTSVKCFWKIKSICSWSYKVSVGNSFLFDYAAQYNKHVVLNPTCVDTEGSHKVLKNQHTSRIVVGWTGSFTTLPFLYGILSALTRLQQRYDFDFMVIADRNPELPLKNYQFVKWRKESEIEDLLKINIGIMPLEASSHTNSNIKGHAEGKCGFKIIQYGSLGIPTVASPYGVNAKIIDHNRDGFLCNTEDEWVNAIEQLLTDADKRERMGKLSRKKIMDKYSLQSNELNFLSLFQ